MQPNFPPPVKSSNQTENSVVGAERFLYEVPAQSNCSSPFQPRFYTDEYFHNHDSPVAILSPNFHPDNETHFAAPTEFRLTSSGGFKLLISVAQQRKSIEFYSTSREERKSIAKGPSSRFRISTLRFRAAFALATVARAEIALLGRKLTAHAGREEVKGAKKR